MSLRSDGSSDENAGGTDRARDEKNRKLLYFFAVGGFIFVNLLLAFWGMRRRSTVGQRDQAIYAVTELGSAIARCSQSRGALVPSAGPTPATLALASTPHVLRGDELLPAGSACTPAKLPYAERWQFAFTRDDALHGRIRARTDRDADGVPDDAISLPLTCTAAAGLPGVSGFTCKTEGTSDSDPSALAVPATGFDTPSPDAPPSPGAAVQPGPR